MPRCSPWRIGIPASVWSSTRAVAPKCLFTLDVNDYGNDNDDEDDDKKI